MSFQPSLPGSGDTFGHSYFFLQDDRSRRCSPRSRRWCFPGGRGRTGSIRSGRRCCPRFTASGRSGQVARPRSRRSSFRSHSSRFVLFRRRLFHLDRPSRSRSSSFRFRTGFLCGGFFGHLRRSRGGLQGSGLLRRGSRRRGRPSGRRPADSTRNRRLDQNDGFLLSRLDGLFRNLGCCACLRSSRTSRYSGRRLGRTGGSCCSYRCRRRLSRSGRSPRSTPLDRLHRRSFFSHRGGPSSGRAGSRRGRPFGCCSGTRAWASFICRGFRNLATSPCSGHRWNTGFAADPRWLRDRDSLRRLLIRRFLLLLLLFLNLGLGRLFLLLLLDKVLFVQDVL
jgi:hypothetical protein